VLYQPLSGFVLYLAQRQARNFSQPLNGIPWLKAQSALRR
jgi:hypothetical protein